MSESSPTPPTIEPLPPYERRVLGVLIEKQKTSKSADAYPMTLNAIVTGCNQKSNRDPVYELDEEVVEEALAGLQKRGLVMKMTGSRAERWRHLLYEAWKVTKVEMAILAELLMRGAQTEGDLRSRASRMDEIKDLEELRGMLASLTERKFVVYLTEPGRRGTMVTHGFLEADELERAQAAAKSGAVESEAAPVRSSAGGSGVAALESKLNSALEEIARLKEQVARLEERLGSQA